MKKGRISFGLRRLRGVGEEGEGRKRRERREGKERGGTN
jgi:hypothetical protein